MNLSLADMWFWSVFLAHRQDLLQCFLSSLCACIGQEFIGKGEMSFLKIQKHISPVRCYRVVYTYNADYLTARVNELFELNEHIISPCLGSFSSVHSPGRGYFLQAFPIRFLRLYLSCRCSSEAAACPSTWQWPPSFLLQINPVLFVLPLSEIYFHIAGPIEQSWKIFSVLRKKHQCSSPCPIRYLRCRWHCVSCKLLELSKDA